MACIDRLDQVACPIIIVKSPMRLMHMPITLVSSPQTRCEHASVAKLHPRCWSLGTVTCTTSFTAAGDLVCITCAPGDQRKSKTLGPNGEVSASAIRRFESSRPSHIVVRSCSLLSALVHQPLKLQQELILCHSRKFARDRLQPENWTVSMTVSRADTVSQSDAEIPSCV